MKKTIFIVLIALSFGVLAQEKRGDFVQNREYPQWFSEAKLGIFIHFGLYSLPSWSGKEQYAEWFYKGLISGDSARIEYQKRVFGNKFKYKDYKKIFKAELFDAEQWAELFKKSGAKYVLFTSKHHDGYCMWNSKYSKGWNSYETAPKRDFCKEITQAVRKQGLEMGMYYSLTEWTNPLYRWTIDTNKSIDKYVKNHLHPQFKELVELFKPTIIFSDGDWDHTYKDFRSDELVEFYYRTVGDKAIVNDRFGKGFNHGYLTPEYSSGIIETQRPWAECRGIGRSFGLNRNEDINSYKTSKEIIQHLVQLVALGGGLTLNVGPGADGQIPLLQQERLLDIGKWLEINGESIYSSTPYHRPYDAKELTTKDDNQIYKDSVINFNWVRNSPLKQMEEDNFNIKWEGIITPKHSETYTISCKADEYAQVYLDDKLIINTQEKIDSCQIRLEKGRRYNLKIDYQELTHEASISLIWESPSQAKEPIKGDFNAVYSWKKPYLYYTVRGDNLYILSLEIPDKAFELHFCRPSPKDMKITFLDSPEVDIPWTHQQDHTLRITTSNIRPSHLKSQGVYVFRLENYFKN